jgi:nucleotide-binding universal stress UspA family protein
MEEKMNNIILVPTDFSEVCDSAIKQAIEAAKYLKFKVVLLHVIDKDTVAYLHKENLPLEAIDGKLKVIADDIRKNHNIEVEFLSREGNIFTTIGDVAADIGVSLVILGTHGKTGMQKLTGSFALKVVTSSPVPVIVVQKRPFGKGYKNIVMPITSPDGPWEKTQWAVYIARQFDAKVHLFTPWDAGSGVKEAVKTIAGYLAKNNVKFTEAVAEKSLGLHDGGTFSKHVVDYAASSNSDLILIMTNPDKNLATFLLGSYDEQIMFNFSEIPVMCINPRKINYHILGI